MRTITCASSQRAIGESVGFVAISSLDVLLFKYRYAHGYIQRRFAYRYGVKPKFEPLVTIGQISFRFRCLG